MTELSRSRLERHSVDMRQFIDFRAATLSNGMQIIDAYNSSGLQFSLLPGRGLDIWTASYNGQALTWLSQGSPYPPDSATPWLRLFNGGLLTTCGLSHAGDADVDTVTGERRDLHGDFTRMQAYQIMQTGGWQGEDYLLELSALVSEATLFGVQFRVHRTYRLRLGEPGFEIVDLVTNLHNAPVPFMLLYHFNLGYPLIKDGTRWFSSSSSVHGYNEAAREQMHQSRQYTEAEEGHQSAVFCHRVTADENRTAIAGLTNEDYGVVVEWDTQFAPYLTQWKNLRTGIFVCGLEPGNCIPEGQNRAREYSRLVQLDVGETQEFRLKFHVLPDRTAVQAMQERAERIGQMGSLVTPSLDDLK